MRKKHKKSSIVKSRQFTRIRKTHAVCIDFDNASRVRDNLNQSENIDMLDDTCLSELSFRVDNRDEVAA